MFLSVFFPFLCAETVQKFQKEASDVVQNGPLLKEDRYRPTSPISENLAEPFSTSVAVDRADGIGEVSQSYVDIYTYFQLITNDYSLF